MVALGEPGGHLKWFWGHIWPMGLIFDITAATLAHPEEFQNSFERKLHMQLD